ncbi:MAG TPA: PPE domain-containing protein, partial [Pseudonocardiaceae bacterium]|nr:PPE domain-containing protein [Pseudonocardiaceae bacterium]
MAEGLLDELATSVEHLIARAVREMFGGGGGDSTGDSPRWEGMSNEQLAAAVRQLNSGPGTTGIQQAADALSTIAGNLQQIDRTLHTQLQAIGVNWQSEASELAQEMTTESAAYTTSASGASSAASAAVNAQGDAFASARNAVPDPSALTTTTTTQPASFLSAAGTVLTGHGTDHVRTVAKSNTARQQTIDALNTYSASSQTHLTSHRTLPQPPAVSLRPTPAGSVGGASQVTTVSSYVPPVTAPSGTGGGEVPGVPTVGGGGGGGGGGLPGLPTVGGGGGGVPGVPTVGG